MKKSIYEVFFFLVSLVALFLCAMLFIDNAKTHADLIISNQRADTYARANQKQVAWKAVQKYPKMFFNIENEIGIPKEILQAMKAHENANPLIEFGVKKIPGEIMQRCAPDEWQSRAGAKIAIQEAFNLILSDKTLMTKYFEVLASRYCNHDKVCWALETEILYKKLEVKK